MSLVETPLSSNSRVHSGIESHKNSRQATASTTRHSKVTFPIESSTQSNREDDIDIESNIDGSRNPFTMIHDNDVYHQRDKENKKKAKERMQMRNLKVHEKQTYASKVNQKAAILRRKALQQLKEEAEQSIGHNTDRNYSLNATKEVVREKESLPDYISKKREMFLVQYSLGVKRDEMRKLEEIAAAEEKKIELAEKYLEQDAAQFDEFLQENDKNSVQAIKIAENETKEKLEKMAEIKRINAQITQYRSEISKFEETLQEYILYKNFLEKLTPQEFREEYSKKNELYFKQPQELLEIFLDLEEQNLTLIQNSQETEEALEEIKQNLKQTEEKMSRETETLHKQITQLREAIAAEEAKGSEMKIRSKMFSHGEYKEEDQEKLLIELNRKVQLVYKNCIGENEANISTLPMLTSIENRLEELFELIETMPRDKVEAAEKEKEKDRRIKAREEKLRQQKLHQEERTRKALERAQEEPKKQTGKKVAQRSEPPLSKKRDDSNYKQISKDEEEEMAFFQW